MIYYWAPGVYPAGMPILPRAEPPVPAAKNDEAADPHLRSMKEVRGYHIHALDGDIGHVDDFLADDQRWTIGHLVVATSNWWH